MPRLLCLLQKLYNLDEIFLEVKFVYYFYFLLFSVFPVCKFGKNCPYLHPACKFGLSCIKIGCIFSHPFEACKYHPFCTKPSCSYFHPSMKITPSTSGSKERAKFTWRKGNWLNKWEKHWLPRFNLRTNRKTDWPCLRISYNWAIFKCIIKWWIGQN